MRKMTFKKEVMVNANLFVSKSAKKFVVVRNLEIFLLKFQKFWKNNLDNNAGLGSHQTEPTCERESN